MDAKSCQDYDAKITRIAIDNWLDAWIAERLKNPYWLSTKINETLQPGDIVSVMLYPLPLGYIQADKFSDYNMVDPSEDQNYCGHLCLLKAQLTEHTAKQLTDILSEIHDSIGLSFKEGMKYVFTILIMRIEHLSYVCNQDSIFFPSLSNKQESRRYLRHIYSEEVCYPLLNIDSMIDLWLRSGQKTSLILPSAHFIKGKIFTIPPQWLIYPSPDQIERNDNDNTELIPIDKDKVNIVKELSKLLRIAQGQHLNEQPKKAILINVFPSPSNLKWDEVSIEFVSDTSLKIRARNTSRTYTFAEIGFKDKRKGDMPDSRWEILKRFAEKGGRIEYRDRLEWKTFARMKTAVKDLRKRLCSIMGIMDDPFYPYKKAKSYFTKFSISDSSYPRR